MTPDSMIFRTGKARHFLRQRARHLWNTFKAGGIQALLFYRNILRGRPAVDFFKLDDCDFIAAESKESAVRWYTREVTGEPVEECEDWTADTVMNIANSEAGEPDRFVTFQQAAAIELARGSKLPFVIGCDSSCL